MRSKYVIIILVLFFSSSLYGQDGPYFEDSYRAFDRNFNAERCFESVEYISQFWRIGGGSGYNNSINWMIKILMDEGFSRFQSDKYSFHVDEDEIKGKVWEPEDYSIRVVSPFDTLLHDYSKVPLGVMRNSFPTPAGGISAQIVLIKSIDDLSRIEVNGKFILAKNMSSWTLYREGIQKKGASGIMLHSIPGYNKPDKYPDMIKDISLPVPNREGSPAAYGFSLSLNDYNYLSKLCESGPVTVKAEVKASFIDSGSRKSLVARICGSEIPEEKIVIVTHIDHYKPGANDNASGAAVLAEIAASLKSAVVYGEIPQPERSIEFVWVDEITGSKDYIKRYGEAGIIANLTLDMVGEDGTSTGGLFRVERMPDPAARWLRPPEQHTEWGGRVYKGKMPGHYLNDLFHFVCLMIAKDNGWAVTTNPFEGGSDHVVFLAKEIPSILLWHFTDSFYHTSMDDVDKVSINEMKNVGLAAAITAYIISMGTEKDADIIRSVLLKKGIKRLENEYYNSLRNVKLNLYKETDNEIISAWGKWYTEAIGSLELFLTEPADEIMSSRFDQAKRELNGKLNDYLKKLHTDSNN